MEEEMQEKEQNISHLVDILYRVHRDNSQQEYYARGPIGHSISIMPLTPFVYEFFLFNSIYQVDWEESFNRNQLIFNSEKDSESQQQRKLLKYLKNYSQDHPYNLYRAFEPLLYIPDLEGGWTRVIPDARVTTEDGVNFFSRIKTLQKLFASSSDSNKPPSISKVFKLIKESTNYVYLVRNNIFHGSKTLGNIYEKNQKRRIEVYEIFLKCITSLFFLSTGKTPVASDLIPCAISSNSLFPSYPNDPTSTDQEILSIRTILKCINNGLMKIGDSKLIIQFTKQLHPPKVTPPPKSTLFYPSAGRDLITPLLLGLPYCTQFYFYERGQSRRQPPGLNILNKIPTVKFKDRVRVPNWKEEGKTHYLEFEFNGIGRRVYWIHSDNLEFLKSGVELSFYFHRGDSLGEGGSAQLWDSEYLLELIKMIPDGQRCVFLTDGQPGDIKKEYLASCYKLDVPFIERNRKYYCGVLADKRA